jgi:hypothetical protein
MSLYWYDSFQDYQASTTGGPGSWSTSPWDANSWCNMITSGGRTQAQCWEKSGFNVPQCTIKRIQVNRADSTIGFAVNFTPYSGVPGSGTWQGLCAWNDSVLSGSWTDNVQLQLQVSAGGAVRVVRGASTVLNTSGSTTLGASGWHFVEFYALIHSTAGAYNVKVDGVSVLSATGVNTQSTANAYQNGFTLGDGGAGRTDPGLGCRVSDLYVLDSSGAAPLNTFLGDVRVIYTQPAANGGTNQWANPAAAWVALTAYAVGQFVIDGNGNLQRCTTAGTSGASAPSPWHTTGTTTDATVTWTFWSLGTTNVNFVKEQINDDAVSYVTDSTLNDEELYTVTALTSVPVGITSALAVGISVRGQRDQTTVRDIRTVLSSGGTAADNGSDLALPNGSYASFKTVFATDPNTGAAPTITAINAMKVGFKVSV